jgi:hypothetical protein
MDPEKANIVTPSRKESCRLILQQERWHYSKDGRRESAGNIKQNSQPCPASCLRDRLTLLLRPIAHVDNLRVQDPYALLPALHFGRASNGRVSVYIADPRRLQLGISVRLLME